MGGAQAIHNVDACSVGQLQVDKDDVGTHQISATHGVSDRPGFSNDLQGLVSVNDLSNATSNDLVIVDDHDARTRNGIFTHVSDSNGREGTRPR